MSSGNTDCNHPARTRRTPLVRNARRGGALTLAAVVGAGVATALAPFIAKEESGRTIEATLNPDTSLATRHVSGKQYLTTYLDMVGVATVCDGITTYNGRPLQRGMRFTERQCAAMLEEELVKHATGVMRCTPGLALAQTDAVERLRQGPRFAAVSLAYNVGVSGYCRSTAAKRFNRGDFSGGCEALTWWNKAGGRVVQGLVARRTREARVCREGLGALS